MFGLDELRQTRFYQEAKEEGRLQGLEEGRLQGLQEIKLETISQLLVFGLTIEQIAQAFNWEIETVRQVAQNLKT